MVVQDYLNMLSKKKRLVLRMASHNCGVCLKNVIQSSFKKLDENVKEPV